MINKEVILDKRDLRILEILDFDARETYSQIAKKLKISKQAVEYRIKNLEKRKIITGYYAVVDIAKLGFMAHRIAIKLHNTTEQKQNEIIDFFSNQKKVGWIFTIGGKWDIALTVYSQNQIELEKEYKKLTHKFSKYISDTSISTIISLYNFQNKFLFDLKENKKIKIGGELKQIKLDEKDYRLLLEVAKNCRKSILKISEQLKENPKTIAYRLKRLEKNKIIGGYRANINTKLLGYDLYKIFLHTKETTKEIEEKIIQYITSIKNSVYFTSAIGIADMEFELKVKNTEQLYEIISKLRHEFQNNIKDFETILIRDEKIISYLPELN